MNYADQERFLLRSRLFGSAAVLLVLLFAAGCFVSSPKSGLIPAIEFGMTTVGLAVFIFYVPAYLHITVDATKRKRWEIKIRWRIIGAALVLGSLLVSNRLGLLYLIAATAWLIVANIFAFKLHPRYCSLYFWATDLLLLSVLFLAGKMVPLLGAILLAASAHLSLVICEQATFSRAVLVVASGAWLPALAWMRADRGTEFFLAAAGLLLASAFTTAFLVWLALRQNAGNLRGAMCELQHFTGLSEREIRRLWSVSDQELAKNWQTAALDENDAIGLAQWYRENSQLYLFAISAYNLEYKRIRSNLKVLRLARGACLDYGAGNGEIVLELARRGHAVTYYDVNGETMKFARHRASQQDLKVDFQLSKAELKASVRGRGFDTIFSLDVLEHLPDLPGELKFLSALLRRGGLFVFDIPAGATRAHPMHLNHHLCVNSYMQTLGLEEDRGRFDKLTFRKEEKYFFRAVHGLSEDLSIPEGSSLG